MQRKQKYRDRAKERRNAEQVHDKLQNLNSATKDSFTNCPTAEHMLEKMGWSEVSASTNNKGNSKFRIVEVY